MKKIRIVMPIADPIYDEFGKPLTRSGVSEELWMLYHTDQEKFKREVQAYFSLGYPDYTVVKASYKDRTIWLRDDRGRSL